MKLWKSAALAAALFSAVAVSGQAATILHNSVADLGKATIKSNAIQASWNNVSGSIGAIANSSVAVAAQDTVVWNLTFADNKYLQMNYTSYISMYLQPDTTRIGRESKISQLDVLNLDGSVTTLKKTGFRKVSQTQGVLGDTVWRWSVPQSMPSSIKAVGFRYTETISGFGSGLSQQTFSRPVLDIGTDGGLSIHSAVPESQTWVLMLLGFGAVGASLRRQRSGRRVNTALPSEQA